MALLDGDDSDDALRLNAEFLWADKDWQAAAGILEKLAPPPAGDLSLSEADSEVLHNLAVAYSLSGQQDDLSRMGGDYGGAMAATAWRDDFARLTGELGEERVTDADELAATARFEAFMSSFKDRLASGEPDRLN
jgi:hypothetical protein